MVKIRRKKLYPAFLFPFSIYIYRRTSMARSSLGPWKFVWDMGSSSHWGLIMALGKEANSDNLGKYFPHNTYCMLSVLITIASMRRFQWVHTTCDLMKNKKKIAKYLFSWAVGRISYGLKNEFELAMVNKQCSSYKGSTVNAVLYMARSACKKLYSVHV